MTWLTIAIIAYLILALVNVADKFILEKVVPGPRTYTFLVGITGGVVIVLAPFGLVWPGWGMLMLDVLVGLCFSAGLMFLYYALKKSEASRVFTLVGGVTPVFTIIFSVLFLQEKFNFSQWLAIVFLIVGTIIISWSTRSHSLWTRLESWFSNPQDKKFLLIILAGFASLFFALFWVGTKFAYITQPFISAFIWIRLGTFLSALLLLLGANSRRQIFKDLKRSKNKKNNAFVFFGTQGLGATGAMLQNYAVAIGSVSLVTSLQGLQYVFLLVLTLFGTLLFPRVIKENISWRILSRKVIAIIFIVIGLYFIAKP
ncbi:hypothetical protein C4566_01600 [Candidatus Parcubacteria bacterium]|nr:MAG: hypothetical protein C4566_01600 [Candidatus Parcubacteria bacterium]